MGKVPRKKKETRPTNRTNRAVPPSVTFSCWQRPKAQDSRAVLPVTLLNKSDIKIQSRELGWKGRAGQMSATTDNGVSCGTLYIHEALKEAGA